MNKKNEQKGPLELLFFSLTAVADHASDGRQRRVVARALKTARARRRPVGAARGGAGGTAGVVLARLRRRRVRRAANAALAPTLAGQRRSRRDEGGEEERLDHHFSDSSKVQIFFQPTFFSKRQRL
jgi:hypothetical protein